MSGRHLAVIKKSSVSWQEVVRQTSTCHESVAYQTKRILQDKVFYMLIPLQSFTRIIYCFQLADSLKIISCHVLIAYHEDLRSYIDSELLLVCMTGYNPGQMTIPLQSFTIITHGPQLAESLVYLGQQAIFFRLSGMTDPIRPPPDFHNVQCLPYYLILEMVITEWSGECQGNFPKRCDRKSAVCPPPLNYFQHSFDRVSQRVSILSNLHLCKLQGTIYKVTTTKVC